MADCAFCKKDMLVVDGCISVAVKIYKPRPKSGRDLLRRMNPIRYGNEQRFPDMREKPQRCHDCNAKIGYFHHPNCDWEECPNCHLQMLTCGGECG